MLSPMEFIRSSRKLSKMLERGGEEKKGKGEEGREGGEGEGDIMTRG